VGRMFDTPALDDIQEVHLNLHTITNIWADSNNVNHIWVIERASFKLAYNWNHLGKLEKFHSDLHTRYCIL